MPARNKRSSLFGLFVSYKENKVLWLRPRSSFQSLESSAENNLALDNPQVAESALYRHLQAEILLTLKNSGPVFTKILLNTFYKILITNFQCPFKLFSIFL